MAYSNCDAYIFLNSINLSNKKIIAIKESLENISEIFEMTKNDFMSLEILKEKDIDYILENKNYDKLEWTKEYYRNLGVHVMTIEDEDYPYSLKNIEDAPQILYIKGELKPEDHIALAVVGSRRLSDYGKEATKFIASEISKLGITVVSGMADGADSIAHRAALKENNRTIAVMGTGIDVIYPQKNKVLYGEISEKGAVITEFPAKMKGAPYNFPRRNRIISGLSLGVVVVEAKEKSGTLITASFAAEQGRDVFAIPGNINSIYSKGTNKLIQDGAKLVMGVEDIVSEIRELRELAEPKKEKKSTNFTDVQNLIINELQNGEANVDKLIARTGLDVTTLQVTLAELELMDFIVSTRRGTYMLKMK
ncbi:DNA processing protein [Ezakiella coagulans]|uniref:DNA processing protein n=1 Tax=Ezakiella coagulans TaxID=46507 RepID=A0A2U1E3W3_9FIRM|nr:DNA-processing protein DprA [Ezakiella coagulans]PVY94626.1 DNA processing protein [Ezakiella coagulans]